MRWWRQLPVEISRRISALYPAGIGRMQQNIRCFPGRSEAISSSALFRNQRV
jgi:hypothetical protein